MSDVYFFGISLILANLISPLVNGPLHAHDKLFQADHTWLPEIHYHEEENDCDDDQAADIEDLLVDLDKRDHLIVVHNHAEREVNPACHSELWWRGPNPGQLNSVVCVLYKKYTH